jgi:hypothetical protein
MGYPFGMFASTPMLLVIASIALFTTSYICLLAAVWVWLGKYAVLLDGMMLVAG